MCLSNFKTYLSINLGKKSTSNYVNQMKGFFLQYAEFNQENINNYLASKVDKWSAGSYNAFFKAVKWYIAFSKIEVELPKAKKVERKPRAYLKENDIDNILKNVPVIFQDGRKVRLVLELLFKTGMRPSELYELKRKNVNIEESAITLVNTKTHLSRVVFITKDLANDIQNYFNAEPEKDNAFNLNNQSLSYYCRMIKQYMNLEINPYQWRHNFAHNYLKKSGNDIVALSQLLGHTNLSSTQVYCGINKEELQERYNKAFKKMRK